MKNLEKILEMNLSLVCVWLKHILFFSKINYYYYILDLDDESEESDSVSEGVSESEPPTASEEESPEVKD